ALFMGIGALLSVDRWVKHRRWFDIALTLLFVVALYLTHSRTTLLLFVCIAVLYIVRVGNKQMRIGLLASIGVGLIAVFLAGGRILRISFIEPTLIERLITYE